MRKQLFAAILSAALPLVALAQGGTPPAGTEGPGGHRPKFDPQRIEKRIRLARTLGLAEALDLDAAGALKLGDTLNKFDDRRHALAKQMHEAGKVLRQAAKGEKVSAADVDQAIQKGLDTRAQMVALNREVVQAVTKDLSPEKKARAVLFLARFQRRFAFMHPGMRPGMHPGMMGPGKMCPGCKPGHGPGMGPGEGPHGEQGMAPMGMEDDDMLGMGAPPMGDELDE